MSKGLNLKNFKKVKSDDKCTVFKDRSGHELRVAHGALSPRRRKEMEAIPFADGGEVEDEPLSDESIKAGKKFGISEEKLKAIRQFDQPSEQRSISSVPGAEEITGPVQPKSEKGWLDQKLDAANDFVKSPGSWMDKANAALPGSGGQEALARRQWKQGLAADQQSASVPVKGPAPASIAPMQDSTPVSEPVQQLQPMGLSQNMGQSLINQFQTGVNQEAAAIGQQAKAQQDVLKQQAAEQQAAMADFNQKQQQYAQEVNAVMEDYKKNYINPNHYQESQSSGQKVMTAIGLILGGMGAGLTGGENMAAKFLSQQIDRDIEAQKANLGKTQSILSFNLQKFGNMRDAVSMTEAMMKGIYATKLDEAGNNAKDKIAGARAKQAAATFAAGIMPAIDKTAQGQVAQGVLNNPNASPLTKIQALPKEMRDNAIKELNDYKNIQAKLGQVDSVMREAFKNTSAGEKLMNPIQSGQRRQVAFAQLFPIAKAIAGERMTDADARALIEPYLPGMTTNQETMEMNIKKLKNQLATEASGRTPILAEYGIVQPLSANTAQEQRLLNWAKMNPKDPKAKKIIERIGG